MTEILTLKELARYLKLSRDTIYRKAKRGEIPAVRVGKVWRFPKELVDQWLQEGAGLSKRGGPFKGRPKQLDPKKDPLLKFVGSIEHGSLAKDIDKELYGS